MGEELPTICDNQGEWDNFLEKNRKVVVSFTTSNTPSRELIQTIKGVAPEYSTSSGPAIKFLQVDVNSFKPKHKDFIVTEVPSVMFVLDGQRKFSDFLELDAGKLKKKIKELVELPLK